MSTMYVLPSCIRSDNLATIILTLAFLPLSFLLLFLVDNLGALDTSWTRHLVTGKHVDVLLICVWVYFEVASAALILTTLSHWVLESRKRYMWFMKKRTTGRVQATRENVIRGLKSGENLGAGQIVDVELQGLGGSGR
jgi:hypothetical protein